MVYGDEVTLKRRPMVILDIVREQEGAGARGRSFVRAPQRRSSAAADCIT